MAGSRSMAYLFGDVEHGSSGGPPRTKPMGPYFDCRAQLVHSGTPSSGEDAVA